MTPSCTPKTASHRLWVRNLFRRSRYRFASWHSPISRPPTISANSKASSSLKSSDADANATTDPITIVGVPIALASVALLACWIPARRAVRIPPMRDKNDCDEFQKLRAHQREAVPAPPPVDRDGNARTVLAGKDSLRRADARPCLLRSVPADLDSRRAAPAGTALGLWLLSVVDKKNVDSVGLLMEVADHPLRT